MADPAYSTDSAGYTASAEPVIVVENLRKSYGSLKAVDDVSFTVSEGEIFGIIGPNGAGKTTMVECISGLRDPDSGNKSFTLLFYVLSTVATSHRNRALSLSTPSVALLKYS